MQVTENNLGKTVLKKKNKIKKNKKSVAICCRKRIIMPLTKYASPKNSSSNLQKNNCKIIFEEIEREDIQQDDRDDFDDK